MSQKRDKPTIKLNKVDRQKMDAKSQVLEILSSEEAHDWLVHAGSMQRHLSDSEIRIGLPAREPQRTIYDVELTEEQFQIYLKGWTLEYLKISTIPFYEKPLADRGLISYRYKGRYGWIMIGAHNHTDALREAGRSTDDSITIENLQVWNETKSCYIEASETPDCLTASSLGRLGGSVRSEVKSIVARENGKKGGRPSKQLDIEDI